VTSNDFTWKPVGQQEITHHDTPVTPVHSDILLAKLRPGQHVHVIMHAVKGIAGGVGGGGVGLC
jgi:DNA-directed RNA polymerase I and III subunit RPAC1